MNFSRICRCVSEGCCKDEKNASIQSRHSHTNTEENSRHKIFSSGRRHEGVWGMTAHSRQWVVEMSTLSPTQSTLCRFCLASLSMGREWNFLLLFFVHSKEWKILKVKIFPLLLHQITPHYPHFLLPTPFLEKFLFLLIFSLCAWISPHSLNFIFCA